MFFVLGLFRKKVHTNLLLYSVCHVNVLLKYFVEAYKLCTNSVLGFNKIILRKKFTNTKMSEVC